MNNKIKIITKLLLVGILLLANTSKTFAISITWNQITTKYKEIIETSGALVTATSDDTNFNIVGKDDYNKYTFNLKYENDIISLIPRNKTDFTEKELSDFNGTDIILAGLLVEAIADLYNYEINNTAIDTEEKAEQYGIYMETTKTEYTDPDTGLTSSGDYIDSLSIDLDKFEKKIYAETKNVEKNSQTGASTMVISWIIGISALVFAVIYINKTFKAEA